MANLTTNRENWLQMRKQAQHVVNKLLWICEKITRCKHQILFLQKCKAHKVIPKGLRINLPEFLERKQRFAKFREGVQIDVIRKALSYVYARKANRELDPSRHKIMLERSFGLSAMRVDFLLNWLWKMAKRKEVRHNESLGRKFADLIERKRARKMRFEEEKKLVKKKRCIEMLKDLLEVSYSETQIVNILEDIDQYEFPKSTKDLSTGEKNVCHSIDRFSSRLPKRSTVKKILSVEDFCFHIKGAEQQRVES